MQCASFAAINLKSCTGRILLRSFVYVAVLHFTQTSGAIYAGELGVNFH